jgi:hypothetical protein
MASSLRKTHSFIDCKMGGGSMGTALPLGSTIRIEFSEESIYAPGMVIAFLSGERIMVHRVMYRGRYGPTRQFILTLGDEVWRPDAPVNMNSILGRVVQYEYQGVTRPPGPPPKWTSRKRLVSLLIVKIMAAAYGVWTLLVKRQ